MKEIRKRYFPALAEYLRSASEASLYQATELGKELQNIGPEEVIAVHEECMRDIALNVESDESLELYNRSFSFLIELMVAYRCRSQTRTPRRSQVLRYDDEVTANGRAS